MEMILNENDIVVGARFDNGTIQDYVDDTKTYGLVRIEDTTANWFLYNEIDSADDIKELYKKKLQMKSILLKMILEKRLFYLINKV